jgi:hypothetical protein
MKKIRLDLDTLSVDSFNTTTTPEERGTVQGHIPPDTYWRYCSDGITCVDSCEYESCNGTCAATDCGTCAATQCGTCNDPSCCPTYCGTCYDASCGNTYCGTCDPYCCCTCSCY